MPKIETHDEAVNKAKEIFSQLKAEGYSYGDILLIVERLSCGGRDFNDWHKEGTNGFRKDA